MLEARNIYKVYNSSARKLQVLKGIDLIVEKEKFFAIFGHSGAGKSTLLHLLGGLDEPTEGKILIDNVDLYSLSENQRSKVRNEKIGFVFQFYHLLGEFSALENVMMPALIRSGFSCMFHKRKEKFQSSGLGSERKNIREQAQALLKNLGLEARMFHFPSELSGGEQQRVAIARALINKPEILLCDEPTGNLDSATGEQILSLLKDLNGKEKTTVVVVTHEKQVAGIADKTVYIKDGEIS